MPNFQLNIEVLAAGPDEAQKANDAARAAIEEMGGRVLNTGFVSMAAPIEVQIVNTKDQTIRTETVVANDLDEAKEILDVGADEFVASAGTAPAVEEAAGEEETKA